MTSAPKSPRMFQIIRRRTVNTKTSPDTEVVGDLLVLVFWLRQRDSDGLTATIINDTGNQNYAILP
jgi:hypothetical protein